MIPSRSRVTYSTSSNDDCRREGEERRVSFDSRKEIARRFKTHRIDPHLPSLLQNLHRRLNVRPKRRTDGESDISEAREDGRLDGSVEELALEVLEQGVHELVAVLNRLRSEGSTDVSDETHGDGAELGLLLSLESGGEVGHEGGDVRVEVLLES